MEGTKRYEALFSVRTFFTKKRTEIEMELKLAAYNGAGIDGVKV